MSTRRAVRPDAMVYRQTRRLMNRRKRNIILPAVVITAIVLVTVLIVVWVRHRR